MQQKRPVSDRFLDSPQEILEQIVFGDLPEKSINPDDRISEQLVRHFSDALPSTKAVLEQTLFRWLDALAKTPPRQPRDRFASVLQEVLAAAIELNLTKLAHLMARNVRVWGKWLKRYSHGPSHDPFETFCLFLAKTVGANDILWPFWVEVSTFEGHRSKECAEIACRVLINTLQHSINLEDQKQLETVFIEYLKGLSRYHRKAANEGKAVWRTIYTETQIEKLLKPHRPSDVETRKEKEIPQKKPAGESTPKLEIPPRPRRRLSTTLGKRPTVRIP